MIFYFWSEAANAVFFGLRQHALPVFLDCFKMTERADYLLLVITSANPLQLEIFRGHPQAYAHVAFL
jgi:hypothetical protein